MTTRIFLLTLFILTAASIKAQDEQIEALDTEARTHLISAGFITGFGSHPGFQLTYDALQPREPSDDWFSWLYGAHVRYHWLRLDHATAHAGVHGGFHKPLGREAVDWFLNLNGQLGYSPRWQLTSQTVNLQGETVGTEYERQDFGYLGLDARFEWERLNWASIYFQASTAYHVSSEHGNYSAWFLGVGLTTSLN